MLAKGQPTGVSNNLTNTKISPTGRWLTGLLDLLRVDPPMPLINLIKHVECFPN